MGETATATILFTDLVDSTLLRSRLGEDTADTLMRAHQGRLAERVAAHQGRLIKAAGDGIMASFDAASDAVRAAIVIQRSEAEVAPDLRIRIGIAAGDVSWEDDDCFGLPVVTASRLQGRAGGGQILVSHVVRALAGDRAGATYSPVGPLDLKGIEAPVDAFEVAWERPVLPAEERSAEPIPLPPPVRPTGGVALVGRSGEWAELVSAWAETDLGGQRLVLLGGEAGAGKTRLAAEFARHCHERGASVLYGGCDDQLALPYQPWVQALDHLIRHTGGDLLGDDADARRADLALLLPGLERTTGVRPVSSGADPEAERYRLYEAVGATLEHAAEEHPVVIVLDDLHWAGTQTLSLLRHLARNASVPRLLVIGTFRDTGDEITDPLAECLADLRRVDGVRRVRIDGFDHLGVNELVAGLTGQALDDDLRRLARDITERSGGNAFFVGELWGHLVDTGAVTRSEDRWSVHVTSASGVPDSVVEVVGTRLARLSPAARSLADLVAVAGLRIEGPVLEQATDLDEVVLDTAVGELVDAGLLEEHARPQLTYEFPHSLLRDSVLRNVSQRSQARLHLRVAEALESVHEADRRPVLSDLARHFAAGASLGGAAKAVDHGGAAARQAVRSVAYEEAISHLETAIPLASTGSREQVDLQLTLADAQLQLGRYTDSQETGREAFAAARALGDAELAARAATSFERSMHTPGLPGHEAALMLTEARAMLGPEDTPLAVQLEGSLARAYAHSGRIEEALETAELAAARARQLDDVESEAVALSAALIATLGDPDRELELASELEAVAAKTADPWHKLYVTSNQLRALLELGRLDEAREVLHKHQAASDRGRYATFQFLGHAFEVSLFLAAGRFADAEQAAERAHAVVAAGNAPFDAGVYGLHMFAIRREQGRLGEVAGVLRLVADQPDAAAVWRPGVAALYAEVGMLDEARDALDDLAVDGFASLPRDAVWPASVSFLADVALGVADVERAALVYEEMAAFRDRNLMVGMTICFGPADRYLGNLAALLARPEQAEDHFETAIALAERSGSPVWEARSRHDFARFLAASGERERAEPLAARAHEVAIVLGMQGLAAEALPDGDATSGIVSKTAPRRSPAAPDGLSPREVEVLRRVARGASNREIGEELHISQNTVANHVRAILQKTGCANRTEAAAYAVRAALVDS